MRLLILSFLGFKALVDVPTPLVLRFDPGFLFHPQPFPQLRVGGIVHLPSFPIDPGAATRSPSVGYRRLGSY